MTISEIFLPEFEHEMASTRKMLERVPEDKFSWKPHDKSMTLGRLASHVAEMPEWAAVVIHQDKLELTPETRPFNAASRAELLEKHDKHSTEAREAIAGASDEEMAKMWSLIIGGHIVFSMPRAGTLRAMVLSHMIHHRGQLSVYLRMNDVAVPGMYGPSADES